MEPTSMGPTARKAMARTLPLLPLAAGLSLAASALVFTAGRASAQQTGYGQTLGTSPQERQLYDSGPGGKGDSILDATNPIDLMNRIRRSTAMEEATPPGSAVDQALKEFEAQTAPPRAGAASPGSGLMQGP